MTDRPTCKTCPYWENEKDVVEYGICRRNAPRANTLVPMPLDDEEDVLDRQFPVWPRTLDREWCGEHPDIPAWIAAKRPPVPEKPVPSIVEAFDALRGAGGDAWDKIDDPEAFLREVRGE